MSAASAATHELPPIVHHDVMKALGERFAEAIPAVTASTMTALEAEHPAVAGAFDADFVRASIEMTNRRMADHLAGRATAPAAPTHVALGAWAARAGVPPADLDAAYRLGARLAFGVVSQIAEELAVPSGAALELARQHVAYVDLLSSESLAGYEDAARAAGAALVRERQRLVEAIFDGGEVQRAARAVGWDVPATIRVGVALAAAELPADLLAGRLGGATVVVTGARPALETSLPVALSGAVALGEAPAGLAQARRLAALVAADRLPPDTLLRWEDHLLDVVVHADPVAAEAFAARMLAPLDDASPAHRALLLETLGAWLDRPGRPQAMATALNLHPQTVRYRIGRLRDRFGEQLDDPQARFALALALRIRR